jgi:hypothetical protein
MAAISLGVPAVCLFRDRHRDQGTPRAARSVEQVTKYVICSTSRLLFFLALPIALLVRRMRGHGAGLRLVRSLRSLLVLRFFFPTPRTRDALIMITHKLLR